jgi:hypothetical protein
LNFRDDGRMRLDSVCEKSSRGCGFAGGLA